MNAGRKVQEGSEVQGQIVLFALPTRFSPHNLPTTCSIRSCRYYEASLHPDLWGEWMLTVGWGRRGTRLGQVRDRPCASYAEGLAMLAAVGKRRAQRGYRALAVS